MGLPARLKSGVILIGISTLVNISQAFDIASREILLIAHLHCFAIFLTDTADIGSCSYRAARPQLLSWDRGAIPDN